ncbi:hypothetical protein PAXINDRAFT_169731 [Paxillus involutus ATCC 200175]|uniref:N-acetyltransferase domain-containing protein n=1 Tax=Paxillus involutus ATCC 200175 TaxID=664439 RepID=A0A0C9U5Z6_PAXIN|nr:hypothetical protein PAXINDRAFT_169731 [Paxillus involutus ATCC 200175]
MDFTTENVYLLYDYTPDPLSVHETILDDLWNTLKRNAVEPGQAASPGFISFADECLLCAQIVMKHNPNEKLMEVDDDSLLGSPSQISRRATLPPLTSLSGVSDSQRVGLIYVHAGPANVAAGEANIGIILRPEMQNHGYAREAVQLVLRWAFDELKFHRVQAAILDTPCKDRTMRLFIASGFSHEGTRRRAVYQTEGDGVAGVWRDVTYLAMVDTDWVLKDAREGKGKAPEQPAMSLWDEMFTRHSREREQLLRWEEKHGRIKRSSSTETLKDEKSKTRDDRELADQITRFFQTEPSTSSRQSSVYGSVPPSPRLNIHVTLADEDLMADEMAGVEGLNANSDLSQRWEEVIEATRLRQGMSDRIPHWLEISPSRRLALPSIPSTGISEGNPQSPRTIPSPLSVPPESPSPPSSRGATPWSDSESEDALLSGSAVRLSAETARIPAIYSPYPRIPTNTRRGRSGSESSSSSSGDSWSDAHSGVEVDAAGSSDWDMVSEESSTSHRGAL